MSKLYIGNQLVVNPDVKLEKVELTQEEYDALTTKQDNVLYLITDAANPLEDIYDKLNLSNSNMIAGSLTQAIDGSHNYVIETDSSQALTIADNYLAGYETYIIIRNTGTADITITYPTGNNIFSNETELVIPAGKLGEISIISAINNFYIRGAA